jgi:transcriptional regulator with XRE-family HTH domain
MRRKRLELGLGLADAAAQLGIASTTLARIEGGREFPWGSLRERLTDLYKEDPDWLFEDVDAAQAVLREKAGERAS